MKASALELFAGKGLRNVTTHDIAHAAGVAAGTFYLHFKDKHELFREIVLESLQELRVLLDEAGLWESGTATMRKRVEAVVGFAEAQRECVRILFSNDTEWAELQSHVLDSFAAHGEAILRAQQGAGILRPDIDPAVMAQAITGMQARVIDWWTKNPDRATRGQIIDTLCKIQEDGVYTAPEKNHG